jgi:Xaa-Pro dipeptidase
VIPLTKSTTFELHPTDDEKSPAEIDLMRYTNWMSSMAHVEVMKACRPGMMEYQLESLFQHHTYTHGGCRHMSYTCICACGPNANILHYGHAGRPNSGRALASGDMALLDMGAEYHCYASDITCSYPVCGTFTDDQRAIYECVLAAQACVIGRLRPGISWVDMHRAAEGEILRGLIRCGVLHVPDGISHDDDGDDDAIIGEMIEADLGAVFMPHGLGHLIGIDTHDVGGYASGAPPRSDRPGLRKLRTARVLETGVVITVEPGCYFIDPLLDAALSDERQRRFIDVDRLNDFRGFGGVRLEDNVWITADGCENLTQCPRTVEEVLDVMKGGVWPREFPDSALVLSCVIVVIRPG